MSQNSHQKVSTSNEIELKEILKPYLKKWYWFIIGPLFLGILTFFYIKTLAPQYQITSTVLIKNSQNLGGEIAGLGNLSGLGKLSSDGIDNEVVMFKAKTLMQSVVEQLGIESTVYRQETFRDVELYKDSSPVIIKVLNEKPNTKFLAKPLLLKMEGNSYTLSSESLKKDIKGEFGKTVGLPFANILIYKNKNYVAGEKDKKNGGLKTVRISLEPLDKTVEKYLKLVKADIINKKVTIIELTINYPERQKAKDIINAMVTNFNLDALKDKNQQSKKTAEFIDDRIAQIAKDLGTVEDQKENFKEANKITDLQTEAGLGLQLSSVNKTRLAEIENQTQIANSIRSYVSRQGVYELLPLNVGLDNTAASEAIGQFNTLIIERDKLLQNATEANPLVAEKSQQINAIRSVIDQNLRKSVESANQTKASIQNEINRLGVQIAKIPVQEKMFRSIERQQQIKETLYLLLLQKREETNITLAMTGEKARVIDYAYSTIKPIAPRKLLILGVGLLVGFLLPLIFIYLKELFVTKIVTKSDIDKMTDTPVIAEIPRLKGNSPELIQQNDLSPMSEAFRILSTNLRFMLPKKKEAKIIFVTSTVKGEGKTFISVNLASVLTAASNKVLLIGSDIRNPQLQRYSPIHKVSLGLSEYLSGNIDDVNEVIYKDVLFNNCDIIFSGAIPPNPTDLLSNGLYGNLLDTLKDKYEYIILDTAPMMLVTDSFLISDFADVTLYVTRSDVSQKEFINFANSNIDSGKLVNPTFVLNDVHQTNLGYGNKYGYGYSQEVDDSLWSRFKNMF